MKIWILVGKARLEDFENVRFVETAKQMKLDLEMVHPEDFEIIATKEGKSSIYHKGTNVVLPDCLIPRMGSGTTYFARALIRHLEYLGVSVLNSSDSIELAKDKLASLQTLTSADIPTPKTVLAK
jgi:gamma-F420-2:alpha-L-glutamate ligase